MGHLYKIESYSEEAVSSIAQFIRAKGGRCCVAGFAVITNHPFKEQEAWRLLPLVGKITDNLTEWDKSCFESSSNQRTYSTPFP
ncbi:hypothetical protein [Vibrio cincinnatiensis]|uniref:hypothetical protein n=1 Tax=Vibrio cincinnatiensis TaxID=675 RepID=UPI001EDE4775|nr:hypothetical protein [Vibrio cincinnatiensis]MCG3728843.1 hypothetical protein [Vibrio cincinnatiensis]